MKAIEWIKRREDDWYVFIGGREVAWVSRTGHLPNEWWWSVPQAGDSGHEVSLEEAKTAAEASTKAYG